MARETVQCPDCSKWLTWAQIVRHLESDHAYREHQIARVLAKLERKTAPAGEKG